MAACGFQFHRLDSPFMSPSHVFFLGLIVPLNALSVSVDCESASLHYQNCTIHPGGVHDLDCFGKYSSRDFYTCVWKPGSHASEMRYTLIVKQLPDMCAADYDFTGVSKKIQLYQTYDTEVVVLENGGSTNCTRAVFKGSPQSLFRCGPPHRVSFRRHSGTLEVSVDWEEVDKTIIDNYSVRYKAQGSQMWSTSPVKSQNAQNCTVENLNASLVYSLQIQCIQNKKCSQCSWSEAYSLPAELMTPPVVINAEEADYAEEQGRRLLTLTWKFPAKETHDGFSMTVVKASGDARTTMKTTHPEIRLVLSYSAYNVSISAFNNVSDSPATSYVIPQRQPSEGAKLNVTVHSNTSFTIYWSDDLIANYFCYSVEWMKKGHTASNKSFYQKQVNYRKITSLQEHFQPYQRYNITLYTRSNKTTCALDHINNTEGTYGTTQFYFIEGNPVSAPANISVHNVTLTSVVLQWSSIPEEDTRGFLLGYVIHYAEYQHKGTETNISVDPALNSYELQDLQSGTTYQVQLSGFTQAGAGVRSKERLITTNQKGNSHFISIIAVFAVAATVLIFGRPVRKRMKDVLWPSIPHPGNSKVMHNLEGPCKLELLKSINTLEVQEWDTSSLQIVEKDVVPFDLSPSVQLPHQASQDEGPKSICNWNQRDLIGRISPQDSTETSPDAQSSSLAFQGGYTTMEMFQQVGLRIADASDA
ncbi:interleukin-31 receptor subunit alpha isoform X2 [Antennarius striatus]|uniref:interleukin-31 receptor subunit alpha isoform X2 n=1 Tax=Antennarius striatus TaxID=241820 RepID=UPI0035B29366